MSNLQTDKNNKINTLEDFSNAFIKLLDEFDNASNFNMNEFKAIEEYPFSNCLRELTQEVIEWVGNMQKELNEKEESQVIKHENECIEMTDNNLVGVAIGYEDDGYLVQTTDLDTHTHLSELIASGLKIKSHAFAIAKSYQEKYGMKIFDWTDLGQQTVNILCPECRKGALRENDEYTEAYCDSCGNEFLLTGEIKVAHKEEMNDYHVLKNKHGEIVAHHHDSTVFLKLIRECTLNEVICYLENYNEDLIKEEANDVQYLINFLTTIKYCKSKLELDHILDYCGFEYEIIKE